MSWLVEHLHIPQWFSLESQGLRENEKVPRFIHFSCSTCDFAAIPAWDEAFEQLLEMQRATCPRGTASDVVPSHLNGERCDDEMRVRWGTHHRARQNWQLAATSWGRERQMFLLQEKWKEREKDTHYSWYQMLWEAEREHGKTQKYSQGREEAIKRRQMMGK